MRSEIKSRSTSANSATSVVVMTFVGMSCLPPTRMFYLSTTRATPALARASGLSPAELHDQGRAPTRAPGGFLIIDIEMTRTEVPSASDFVAGC